MKGPKKPKTVKPKKPRVAKPAKAPKAANTSGNEKRFNSPVNEEDKALFLQTLPKIADLKAKVATATANLRNAYKTAKKDGFLKGDFDVAFQIQGAEGEKAKKAAIARDLTIAKWLGCDLGAQLDLFVEDERVPIADRAYEEGKAASMQNQPAKPSYDPSTEAHRRYMAGFHDHQATLGKGIKPLHPAVAEDVKAAAAAKDKTDVQKAEDAKAFAAPTSGVAMTRSQHEAAKAAAGKPN